MEDKIPLLTKEVFEKCVTKKNDIHIILNTVDMTITSLEFEGTNTIAYNNTTIIIHPFIDWKGGSDDNCFIANVNLEFNDKMEIKPA